MPSSLATRVRAPAQAAALVGASLVYTGALLALAGVVPVMRFARERIEIVVRPSSFAVDGLYVYTNPWPFPVVQGLRVPFPHDPGLGVPATVEVVEVDPATGLPRGPIPVRWCRGEPRFGIRAPARGEARVRVRFTQHAVRGSGRYILLTTRPWGSPLERGEYVLRPDGVRITGSSYDLDREGSLGFVRHDFMPERDWGFTWTALAD